MGDVLSKEGDELTEPRVLLLFRRWTNCRVCSRDLTDEDSSLGVGEMTPSVSSWSGECQRAGVLNTRLV